MGQPPVSETENMSCPPLDFQHKAQCLARRKFAELTKTCTTQERQERMESRLKGTCVANTASAESGLVSATPARVRHKHGLSLFPPRRAVPANASPDHERRKCKACDTVSCKGHRCFIFLSFAQKVRSKNLEISWPSVVASKSRTPGEGLLRAAGCRAEWPSPEEWARL